MCSNHEAYPYLKRRMPRWMPHWGKFVSLEPSLVTLYGPTGDYHHLSFSTPRPPFRLSLSPISPFLSFSPFRTILCLHSRYWTTVCGEEREREREIFFFSPSYFSLLLFFIPLYRVKRKKRRGCRQERCVSLYATGGVVHHLHRHHHRYQRATTSTSASLPRERRWGFCSFGKVVWRSQSTVARPRDSGNNDQGGRERERGRGRERGR